MFLGTGAEDMFLSSRQELQIFVWSRTLYMFLWSVLLCGLALEYGIFIDGFSQHWLRAWIPLHGSTMRGFFHKYGATMRGFFDKYGAKVRGFLDMYGATMWCGFLTSAVLDKES